MGLARIFLANGNGSLEKVVDWVHVTRPTNAAKFKCITTASGAAVSYTISSFVRDATFFVLSVPTGVSIGLTIHPWRQPSASSVSVFSPGRELPSILARRRSRSRERSSRRHCQRAPPALLVATVAPSIAGVSEVRSQTHRPCPPSCRVSVRPMPARRPYCLRVRRYAMPLPCGQAPTGRLLE